MTCALGEYGYNKTVEAHEEQNNKIFGRVWKVGVGALLATGIILGMGKCESIVPKFCDDTQKTEHKLVSANDELNVKRFKLDPSMVKKYDEIDRKLDEVKF